MALKLFLYLARKDKQGLQVLTTFPTTKAVQPIKIVDLSVLGLPPDLEKQVSAVAYTNRMYWDVWAQSAQDFQELKRSLQKRGYRQLPLQAAPLVEKKPRPLGQKPFIPETSGLKTRTMLRRRD